MHQNFHRFFSVNMLPLDGYAKIITRSITIMTVGVFFDWCMVHGLGRLSRTCKAFRYLQQDKQVVLAAILGSITARLHFESILSFFGMMPSEIAEGSDRATRLLQIADAFEQSRLDPHVRKHVHRKFYELVRYTGKLTTTDLVERRQLWREMTKIFYEMLTLGIAIGDSPCRFPWGKGSFEWRTQNADGFSNYYASIKHAN
jgi:hypothetical protein